MDEIRTLLQQALPPDQPALTITRERAVTAGRRARTTRGWLAAGACALSVLAIAGGVAWSRAAPSAAPGIAVGAEPTPGGPTSLPVSTPSPTTGQVNNEGSPPDQRFNVKPALTSALVATTAAVAPGVVVAGISKGFADTDLTPYEVVRSQGGFKAWADLRDSRGKGHVFLSIDEGQPFQPDDLASYCQGGPNPGLTCSAEPGPGGTIVSTQEGTPDGGVLALLTVTVVRADGLSIMAMTQNYSYDEQRTTRNPQPQRPAPPLTRAQLVDLLTAPAVQAAL